jgi:hypothetical protein
MNRDHLLPAFLKSVRQLSARLGCKCTHQKNLAPLCHAAGREVGSLLGDDEWLYSVDTGATVHAMALFGEHEVRYYATLRLLLAT